MRTLRCGLVVFMCVIFPLPALAEDFYSVQYIRNYDGDTITVTIPGLPSVFGHELGIRLNGIDTPEIRGKCENEKQLAKMAKHYVQCILERAWNVDLLDVGRGKYFRVVATVIADGFNINEWLLYSGLAIPYDGGTKTNPWCE